MRLAFEDGFNPDERITLSDVHETALRQFHQFRDAYETVPEHSSEYEERRQHNKRGAYITDAMAHWIAYHVDDQKTMIGRKLNEKYAEIKAEGQAVNWARRPSETVQITLSTNMDVVPLPEDDSLAETVKRELSEEMNPERIELLLDGITVETVEETGTSEDGSQTDAQQQILPEM